MAKEDIDRWEKEDKRPAWQKKKDREEAWEKLCEELGIIDPFKRLFG